MKKFMILMLSFFLITAIGLGWSFVQMPQASVIPSGHLQWVLGDILPTIGIGGFSQFGIEGEGFFEEIQILKEPVDASVGMMIRTTEKNSLFMAMGKKLKYLGISTAISYNYSTLSTPTTSFTLYTALNVPTNVGDFRIEYKKGSSINLLVAGIAGKFKANEHVKWLFNSITVAVGLGWNLSKMKNYLPSQTYFVFQYTKFLK